RAPSAAFLESLGHGLSVDDAMPLMRRVVSGVGAGTVTLSPVPMAELRRQRAPREELAKQDANAAPRHHELRADAVLPSSDRERELATLWAEALGIDAVAV